MHLVEMNLSCLSRIKWSMDASVSLFKVRNKVSATHGASKYMYPFMYFRVVPVGFKILVCHNPFQMSGNME